MVLSGEVMAITGGFGNIGVALAIAATAAAARVAMIGRGKAPSSGTLPALLSNALVLGNVDVTAFDAAKSALATVTLQFGGLDVLANIAGAFRWQTLAEGDLANWDLLYAVNLKTAVVASKAALSYLRQRGGGRIVNVGAGAAVRAGPGTGAYAASSLRCGPVNHRRSAPCAAARIEQHGADGAGGDSCRDRRPRNVSSP
jgi:NAD(P)-dependent dehydrogenase (short-subunit alcohol dehydrogenase family)